MGSLCLGCSREASQAWSVRAGWAGGDEVGLRETAGQAQGPPLRADGESLGWPGWVGGRTAAKLLLGRLVVEGG